MTNKKRRNIYAKILRDLGVDFVTAHKVAKWSFRDHVDLDLSYPGLESISDYLVSSETGWSEYFDSFGTWSVYRGKSGAEYGFWNGTLW